MQFRLLCYPEQIQQVIEKGYKVAIFDVGDLPPNIRYCLKHYEEAYSCLLFWDSSGNWF